MATNTIEREDRPDFVTATQQRQEEAVRIVRDVYKGTLELRRQGSTYLPRFPREEWDGYSDRRNTAVLFNGLKRTVHGLTGMVFRKDPVLGDDVPEKIEEHTENIDLAGRPLPAFARDIFEASILDGHAFIFVDWSVTPDMGVETLADEQRVAARPYWIEIPKSRIRSARHRLVGGRPVLAQVAWKETATEPKGKFGERTTERIRDYRLTRSDGGDVRVTWTLYQKVEDGDRFEKRAQGMLGEMDEIPLAPVYVNRLGRFFSEPPLLDLAFENLRHFQLRSDRDNTLHIAGVPVPVFIGLEDSAEDRDKLEVGSDSGISLPMGGDAKYLEPRGVALDASRQELQDIERRMAVLGLSMLMSEKRAAETATSKRIDKSESDSQLAVAARGLEQALKEALRLHAKWMRLESGGTVEVNRDFEDQMLDPQMVRILSDLVSAGQLSIDTMWDVLVAGEILPDHFDPELEHGRLGSVEELERFVALQGNGGG